MRIDQTLPFSNALRLAAWGLFFLAPSFAVPFVMVGLDVAELLHVETHRLDLPIVIVAAIGALASVVVPPWLLWLRDPLPARLELDEWGATEWSGDRVRTAIPWSDARVFTARHERTLKNYGRTFAGAIVSIASSAGWAITTCWGVELPPFARRRRVQAGLFDPAVLPLGGATVSDRVVIDPRDDRRSFHAGARFFGAVWIACVVYGLAQVPDIGRGDNARAFTCALLLGAVAMSIRCTRPLRELRVLRKEARRFAGSRAFVLTGESDGALAKATSEDGAVVDLDLGGCPHPDARLATRMIRVFAVVDGAGGDGPYRSSGPLHAERVETIVEREERRRLLLANRVELAARLFVIALHVAVALLVAFDKQVH